MKNPCRHCTGTTVFQHSGLRVMQEQLPIRLASELKQKHLKMQLLVTLSLVKVELLE